MEKIDLTLEKKVVGVVSKNGADYNVYALQDLPLYDLLRFDKLVGEAEPDSVVAALKIIVPDMPEDVSKTISSTQFHAIVGVCRKGGEGANLAGGEE